jgi:hypothetical protein
MTVDDEHKVMTIVHNSKCLYKLILRWEFCKNCNVSKFGSSIYTILKVCHRSIYKPHIPSCYVGCTDSSSRSSIYTILKVCHHSIYKPHIPWCYVGCTDSLSRSSIYTILKVCHRSIYKPHSIPSTLDDGSVQPT